MKWLTEGFNFIELATQLIEISVVAFISVVLHQVMLAEIHVCCG